MELLVSTAAFIVAIGLLVTVHEFGHFWVARKSGVKVLRFSIGFGKVLKSYQRGEITYTLCAIPLGGFVKMLDETETEVDKSEQHRAFNRQSVYTRIAIVGAGPLANFLLAIVLYSLVFVIGTQGVRPVVGIVESDSIAQQSGLDTGDQLLSLNQVEVRSIGEFSTTFVESLDQQPMHIQARSATLALKDVYLDIDDTYLNNPSQRVEQYLGFAYQLPELAPVINQVMPGTPADRAGLHSMDKVIAVNDQSVNNWPEFVAFIQPNAGKVLQLQIQRDGQDLFLNLTPELVEGHAKIGVSVFVPEDHLDEYLVNIEYNYLEALPLAVNKVYQLSLLNLKMIKKMLLGSASVEQLSGPLSIASYAGKSAQIGLVSFLSFLALISVGLGLINLLPIPLLDGGHLLFYLIEIIKGSKVSQDTQQLAFKFGILLILSLTFVALYNDVLRLF